MPPSEVAAGAVAAAAVPLRSETDGVRERLLKAAATVFGEKGYDGTRVQEIARRADLTTGAIYANFAGKADLLLEAINHLSGHELDALTAVVESGTAGVDSVAQMGAELATRTVEEEEFLLLEALIAVRRDPDVRRVVGEHVRRREELFHALIAQAREQGDLDASLDADSLTRFSFALAFGFLVFEAMDFPHPDPDAWATLIRRVVDSLRSEPESGGEDSGGRAGDAARAPDDPRHDRT